MFGWLARLTTRHPWKIIVSWALLLAVSAYFALHLSSLLTASGNKDPESESAEAQRILEENFADRYPNSLIVLVQSDRYQVSDKEYQQAVERITEEIAKHKMVRKVENYYSQNQQTFISKDKKKTFISIG
jgi:RND superfamily putative drug exporter